MATLNEGQKEKVLVKWAEWVNLAGKTGLPFSGGDLLRLVEDAFPDLAAIREETEKLKEHYLADGQTVRELYSWNNAIKACLSILDKHAGGK